MSQIKYNRSTRGYQTRRRAELDNTTSPTNTSSNIFESAYKTQLDLAVKGVLFECLYPLSCEEITARMTWLIPPNNSSKTSQVFASLQRLITSNLVVATRVVEQEKNVVKYLLNLPYEYIQQERAARVRTTLKIDDSSIESMKTK